MRSSDPLRESLLGQDEEFRQLSVQHEELDDPIDELSRQPYRTNTEELEEATLKKRKLQLKDQMETMIRRHRELSNSHAVPALQPHARSF
jgi:uncharacterized protein YdcH (DUF465 family)